MAFQVFLARRIPSIGIAVSCAFLLFLSTGCSIRQIAVNSIADSLSTSGDVIASDNDPELIRDAAPFSLKLMESVLAETPNHNGLLTATSSSFTQYAYAFVVQDADELETTDIAAANAKRDRARKLLIRARDYGLRAIDVNHKGFSQQLHSNPKQVVGALNKSDVPAMYWTATAWAAAISISKNDPDLVGDQSVVEALIDRALELDESYQSGAIHSLLISYEPARQGVTTTPESRARKHFERAIQLSDQQMAAPYVALAEAVSIQKQNRAEFESLLKQALAIDVDKKPQWRLANLIMQRRANWLLSRTTELFVE